MTTKIFRLLVAILCMVLTVGVAVGAAGADGFERGDEPLDRFYGTFDLDVNYFLLTGGSFDDFCLGSTSQFVQGNARIFDRNDGTTITKVNQKDSPLELYTIAGYNDGIPWLIDTCAAVADGASAPVPIATGTGMAKLRRTVTAPASFEEFNSIIGSLDGTPGTDYAGRSFRVWGSADVVVEDGVLLGDPAEFVNLELRENNS